MSMYKTLKTIGLAAVVAAGMAASAAVGYFSGNSAGHRAGYLKGCMDGKVKGENGIVETVEKYAPGTIDQVMSEMKDEMNLLEFESTIDNWLGIPEDAGHGIEPDFDKWLEQLPEQPAPENKTPRLAALWSA